MKFPLFKNVRASKDLNNNPDGVGTPLVNVDVERIDGVDKPATGRRFLIIKSQDTPNHVFYREDANGPWSRDGLHTLIVAVSKGWRWREDGTALIHKDTTDRLNIDTNTGTFERVRKSAPVSHAIREPKIVEDTPPRFLVDGNKEFEASAAEMNRAVRQRLGDMSVLPSTVSEHEKPPASPVSDNWLRVGTAYVGGRTVTGGDFVKGPKSPKPGDRAEPDANARPKNPNFQDPNEDDMIPGPANVTFEMRRVKPGNVGGVPIQKTKDSIKSGVFTSWLRDVTSRPAGFETRSLWDDHDA